jgi:IS5 family transposase
MCDFQRFLHLTELKCIQDLSYLHRYYNCVVMHTKITLLDEPIKH